MKWWQRAWKYCMCDVTKRHVLFKYNFKKGGKLRLSTNSVACSTAAAHRATLLSESEWERREIGERIVVWKWARKVVLKEWVWGRRERREWTERKRLAWLFQTNSDLISWFWTIESDLFVSLSLSLSLFRYIVFTGFLWLDNLV